MRFKIWVIQLSILFFVVFGITRVRGTAEMNTPPQANCSISSKGPQELIEFLNQQEPGRADGNCIEYAIERLGFLESVEAAPVLAKFLDFPAPMSPKLEEERMLISSAPRYKAIEALYKIGGAAERPLVEIMRDRFAPSIKFKNALATYLDIHRENIEGALKGLRMIAANDLCPSLRDADDESLILFLSNRQKNSTQTDSGCTGFAVLELGKSKSSRAAITLIGYLDYDWESSNGAENLSGNSSLYQRQRYPAITAFLLGGSRSLTALLRAIRDSKTPSEARFKAIETVMLIYAEYPPQGVAVLRSVSSEITKGSPERLTEAMGSAIQWCDETHRPLCEAAAIKKEQ